MNHVFHPRGLKRSSLVRILVAGALLGGVTLAGLRLAFPLEDPPQDAAPLNAPRMPNYDFPVNDGDMDLYLTGDRDSAVWKDARLRLTHWQEELPTPRHDDAEARTRLDKLTELRRIAAIEAPMRIAYYVGSAVDKKALGGNYQHDDNYPKRIPGVISKNGPTLELFATLADPSDSTSACLLYIVNRGNQQAEFQAADSNLPVTRQAMRDDGTWADIDEYARYWCGNSYHRVFLPKNRCWRITVPSYHTGAERKVRFSMKTDAGSLGSNEVTMRVPESAFDNRAAITQ